jgi:hypothetical protein
MCRDFNSLGRGEGEAARAIASAEGERSHHLCRFILIRCGFAHSGPIEPYIFIFSASAEPQWPITCAEPQWPITCIGHCGSALALKIKKCRVLSGLNGQAAPDEYKLHPLRNQWRPSEAQRLFNIGIAKI